MLRTIDYLLAYRFQPDRRIDFGAQPMSPAQRPGQENGDLRGRLADILASELYRLNARRVLLPVTAGLDSRGLLGAVLDVLPNDAIHTFTIGEPTHPDVVGGRAAARRAGVAWDAIDPRSFNWDTDHVRDNVRRKGGEWSGHATPVMNPFVVFMHHAVTKLGPTSAGETALVSGFFGGPIAGRTVRPRDLIARPTRAYSVQRFLQGSRRQSHEHRIETGPHEQELHRYLIGWLKSLHSNLNKLGQAGTYYDLLNWHFRARRLLLTAVSGATASWTAPYMSSAWLQFWFEQQRSARFNQLMYRRELRKAYPTIFVDLDEPEPSKWKSRVMFGRKFMNATGHGLERRVKGRSIERSDNQPADANADAELLMSEQGDPRKNKSLMNHLVACADSFDDRNLYRWSASDDLERTLESPTYGGLVRIMSVAMLEVNLQVGNLHADSRPSFS